MTDEEVDRLAKAVPEATETKSVVMRLKFCAICRDPFGSISEDEWMRLAMDGAFVFICPQCFAARKH